MEVVNLLKFLNNVKAVYALNYVSCEQQLVNFLDLMIEDEQFTQKIDLGLIFVKPSTMDRLTIVDGISRLISLSLLLHAICECYKKTTQKNEQAIKVIRSKYLLNGSKTKLHLPEKAQIIYDKIIYGERLSGKEKKSELFILLHNFWTQIKEEKLQASSILKMLKKIYITKVETDNVSPRDLYYKLNQNKCNIDQILLIEDYLLSIGIKSEWDKIQKIYSNFQDGLYLFFRDYFITKFNFKEYSQERLYELFVNYFETMLQYMPEDVIIAKIKRSAVLYKDIININIDDESIKKALIKIKMHQGEDTYAYILNIYEDYMDKNLSYTTLLEVLMTIDEYLKNRLKNPNKVDFNELISYLNAFITCK